MQSYKPEFLIGGKWYDNAVRFATEEEARNNAYDKFLVWTVPTDYRATPSDDPPNYRYGPGGLEPIK